MHVGTSYSIVLWSGSRFVTIHVLWQKQPSIYSVTINGLSQETCVQQGQGSLSLSLSVLFELNFYLSSLLLRKWYFIY